MCPERHSKLLVFSLGVYCYNTYLVKTFNAFYLNIRILTRGITKQVTQHARMFMSSLLDIECYSISILLSFIGVLDNYQVWTTIDEHRA